MHFKVNLITLSFFCVGLINFLSDCIILLFIYLFSPHLLVYFKSIKVLLILDFTT